MTKKLVDGAYSVKVTKDLDEREVPVHCLIHCELTLPNTGYSVAEKIPHIRGKWSTKYPTAEVSSPQNTPHQRWAVH